MKVRTSIRADKKQGDKLVRRRGRLRRINKRNPRRNCRQK